MSKDISIQIQHPNTTIEFKNPSITIEMPDHSTQIEFQKGQPIEIQVIRPNIVVELGCKCSGGSGSGGGHTILDESTPLPQRAKLKFTGAGVTATDDSGNDTTVVTIPGGGGAGITEITYADAVQAITNSALTPGAFYNITDAAGTDGGFICVAVATNAFSVRGAGMFGSEFNAVEFDFANNQLIYRSDLIGNVVRGADAVAAFPWGYSNVSGNTVNNGLFSITVNPNAFYRNNTIYPGASVTNITAGDNFYFENNILENGGQISGITAGSNCSISRNKIGPGATLGGNTTMGDGAQMNDMVCGPSSNIANNTLGASANMSYNNLGTSGVIYGNTIEDSGQIFNNIIQSDGSIENNIVRESASIANNQFSQGARITDCEILPNGRVFSNAIEVGGTISNKAIGYFVQLNGNTFNGQIVISETISESILNSRCVQGASIVQGAIEITGLTTLDITAAWAQYRGIYNLTSSNASEALDTILDFPTAFPFTLKPASGLTLTITGTQIGSIAAGQIALKAASYTLDGSKGEYIVLEADPTNTYLVEKLVVNGIV